MQKAVNTAQGLHQRWMELQQDPGGASKEEVDWTTNELRNSLRSIEWDLEDLDETINIPLFLVAYVWTWNGSGVFYVLALTLSLSIVEANPKKFNLDAMELAKRKDFITSTRQTVRVSRFERLAHMCPNGTWIFLIDFHFTGDERPHD